MVASGKPKIFFIVTIPTHLRVMMDCANLVAASGAYEPQIIYYPSAVYDQNYLDCAHSTYQAFTWRPSGRFVRGGEDEQLDDTNAAKSIADRKPILARLLSALPHKGIYRRLRQRFSFLPHPSTLLGLIHGIWGILQFCFIEVRKKGLALIRFFFSLYWLLHSSWQILLDKWHIRTLPLAERLQARPLLQRYLLATFAEIWGSPLRQNTVPNIGFKQWLKNTLNDGVFVGLHNQKIFIRGFSELLEKEKPSLIVLPEENLFYDSHLIVHAAHSRNIRCAVVPFTIVNTLEWAEAFYNVGMYHADKGWNRIFAMAFPHWALRHRGRTLILPPVYIMTCEYLGIVPSQPWVISSGPADAIAAESQFMCDYYLRAGIRSEKIRLTGTVADDKLYALLQSRDEARKMLSVRSSIEIQGKVILIGLPPDQFPGGKRPRCEFDGYDELIRFMVGTIIELCARKHTVLINLHPRVNPTDVAYLESLGATIIMEPIEQLIPLADIYVAVVSATIRLAISCGVPVVNYDAYQYNYDDYNNLPGVYEVNSRNAYKNAMSLLIQDEAFFSTIQSAQQETAQRVALIDGKAASRMLRLFDELCRN